MTREGRPGFPAQIAMVLLVTALIVAYPLWRFGSAEIVQAVAVGAALATLNVLLGYMAIVYARGKSSTTFLKAVLGGMGLRLVFLLGAMTLLIMAAGMHAVALTVSVVALYAVFLVLEILFLQG